MNHFKIATDQVQRDDSLMYDEFICFKALSLAIKTFKKSFGEEFTLSSLKILKEVWEKFVNREVAYASAFLSGDKEFVMDFDFSDLELEKETDLEIYSNSSFLSEEEKIHISIGEFISSWGGLFLKTFYLKEKSLEELQNILLKQIASFSSFTGKFFYLKGTFDKFREKNKVSNLYHHKHELILWDSRDFWALAKNSVPELGLVDLCLLNVNPTEASG
jgi:hypothetical protein